MKFTELALNDQLLEAISYMGFEEATPIQEMAIPIILDGGDLLACAQTGTGKTAAFLLPILNLLSMKSDHQIRALIIVPTRELAMQIDQQVQGLGYFVPVESMAIYGGGDGPEFEQQKKTLTRGTDIIVATPGKLISHLNLGYVKFDQIQHLILDEADRMLDMGFHEDIKKIISYLPKRRQNLMFSATMPLKISQLAKQIMNNPAEISLALSKPAEGVLQAAYLTYDHQKSPLIIELVKGKEEYKSILIFSSTKKKVGEIVRALKGNNFEVAGISSDLEQSERENVLARFRSKRTRILVATDVLSRGIDIKDINLVINYDVPNDAEDYVHRVGRTARADTTGVALTLINEDDMYKFGRIENLIERDVMKIPLPADLGEGPIYNPKQRPPSRFGRKGGHGRSSGQNTKSGRGRGQSRSKGNRRRSK
ncbi:MAG: DEAD/DEAH box helicase [Saprospiraceae bacterium]|nr:DEAD/DEAH box helicase [Saprospiraceae bacterium]